MENNLTEIKKRFEQGYTMSIYGTRDLLHEQMHNDMEALINIINTNTPNCSFEEYLVRLKKRRTDDGYRYTDNDFEKCNTYIMDCWVKNISPYICLEQMNGVINK